MPPLEIDSDSIAEKFFVEQYKVLQQKILKRIEFQYQVIGLALVVLGTILTIGLDRDSASIILVYPFLVLFLASVWSQNDVLIRQMREYIIESIENRIEIQVKPWETYRKVLQDKVIKVSILRSSRRLFVGMQIISMMVAVLLIWLHATISSLESALLIIDFGISILTFILLRRRSVDKDIIDILN
jgi:hypothetical protein